MKTIKTTKLCLLGAMIVSASGIFIACQKQGTRPTSENVTATTQASSEVVNNGDRMWSAGKQLYALGLNAVNEGVLYTLTPPPIASGLTPSLISEFYTGAGFSSPKLTHATGIACLGPTNQMIVSTDGSSNIASSLLIYPAGSFLSPTALPSSGLSDIEFNEYDGRLYGINGTTIVEINMTTGLQTVNLNVATSIPAGYSLRSLCNQNGLLSYCVADNTAAPDNFYQYSPLSPTITPPLFTSNWGVGNSGGMQYCNGFGWLLISSTNTKRMIMGTPPYTPTTPWLSIGGGPYNFKDLTSN